MSLPIIKLRFSITIGDNPTAATSSGPDTEAQIGIHHDTGWVDTGLGFRTPGTTDLEDE